MRKRERIGNGCHSGLICIWLRNTIVQEEGPIKFRDVVLGHWMWLGEVISRFFSSTRDQHLYYCLLYIEDDTGLTFTRIL